MKRHALGLTLVELITVVAIIAILVGLLVPAVNVARRFAKETQQRAQLTAIDAALMAFRNDFGDYPPSNPSDGSDTPNPLAPTYCGVQKLAEALVGRDMRGFNALAYPYLATTGGGKDAYYPDLTTLTASQLADNLGARKGLYLDTGTANAFRLCWISDTKPGLYPSSPGVGKLAQDTFVLCDVYARRVVQMHDGNMTKEVKLGSPILYYRADTTKKVSQEICNYYDNYGFIRVKERNDQDIGVGLGKWGDGASSVDAMNNFYRFIGDPRVTPTDGTSWGLGQPYRSDSYILVSAGADGMYGTSDDVCNFPNVPR